MFFLFGCVNDSEPEDKYSPYLPEQEGSYGLYIVADSPEDEINHEILDENNINNVSRFSGSTSIEHASLDEIEEVPTYLVFDENGKSFETNDREELFDFLREH